MAITLAGVLPAVLMGWYRDRTGLLALGTLVLWFGGARLVIVIESARPRDKDTPE